MRGKGRVTTDTCTAPFVKPFRTSRRSKNDRNNAEAIAGENQCSPIVRPSCFPPSER